MKTFSIHKHPDHRLEAVKQGISFPGLLLGGVWLLWHGMWFLGSLATVLGLGCYVMFPSPEGYVFGIPYGHRFGLADIINLAICCVVAFCGNGWRATSLADKGIPYELPIEDRARRCRSPLQTRPGMAAEVEVDPASDA